MAGISWYEVEMIRGDVEAFYPALSFFEILGQNFRRPAKGLMDGAANGAARSRRLFSDAFFCLTILRRGALHGRRSFSFRGAIPVAVSPLPRVITIFHAGVQFHFDQKTRTEEMMKRKSQLMASISVWVLLLMAFAPFAADAAVTVVEGCDPATFRRGGVEDDFAPPDDLAFLSDELAAAVSPPLGWKDFDDTTINRHLGHRFRLLPPQAVKIVLEIRMKDGGSNDGLAVGLNPPGSGSTFAFSTEIAALPEANGTWPQATATTFTLDLSDLPGGVDILSQVVADRFLDIRVQDDTTVDYAKLNIWTCTPSTYRAGAMDEFAPPTDLASRRAALEENVVPPIAWKSFDDPTRDRFVGHTFRNLPDNIIQAEIEVRMRPSGGGSNNDTWSLGLDLSGPNPRFTQGIVIRDWTRNQRWIASENVATTFVFDLGTLSNGAELLAKVAADRFLDVVIQDDTEVDYMKLRVWTCPQRPIFTGWPHVFNDNVDYAVVPSGFLEITNRTPVEPIRVDVAIDGVEGYCMGVEEICLGDEGTALDLAIKKETEGFQPDDEFTGVLSFTGTDPIEVSVVFDPAVAIDVTVINGEERGPRFSGLSNGPVLEIPPDTCIQEFDFIDRCYSVLLTDPVPVTVLTDGRPTQTGDRIEICHDIVVGITPLESFELTAAGLSELTLTRGAAQMFGLLSSALGGATFEPGIERLTLANLGDNGEDGIAIALEDAALAEVAFDPLDLTGVAPPGSFLRVDLRGTLGITIEDLCFLIFEKLEDGENGFSMSADFSAIDAQSGMVEVRRDGQVVRRFPGQAASSATVSQWPIAAGARADGTGSFTARFPTGTSVEVGGTVVQGDEVRLIAESPGADIVSFSELALRTAGLPEITLAGIEAATCASGDTALCLNDDRFEVAIEWRTPTGQRGAGRAARLTDDTGTFWFFNEDNVEVVIKVLDACGFADRFWVFAAGLTNVEVEITVTDTVMGAVKTYINPLDSPFQPILDTDAFATCPIDGGAALRSSDERAAAIAKEILLNDDRFRVDIEWQTSLGERGTGQAVRLTNDSGFFWFFNEDNVEVVIKVLDACGFADRFWVFAAGLTNVEVEITVTDTMTGAVKTYSNPLGSPFQPILDTSAFATCPSS